ncbi:group 1 truncated hemoglobin [Kineobactrum sediminis]|uniref:Group 1 truncated hemoglobin n=2 Tax=Kineobactrum sediminis TaxID=1905677 RepID=A0A2N5Y250_9GAMM|nr:group 1 truncated hemoglobin [Kineobactrum sediminis]
MFIILQGGCAGTTEDNVPEQTLYHQLGGMPGIDRIVAGLLWEIAEDSRILPLFTKTNITRFQEKLAEQLCDIADGPCTYTGDTMKEAHRRLAVTPAQFNNLVDGLIRVMEREGISVGAQNALLQRLALMHGDIVFS